MSEAQSGLPPILLPGYAERQTARAIIVLSALFVAFQWLLIIAAPGFIGPMFIDPTLELAQAVAPWVAIAMQVIGLVWMVRIYRAATHVEPDHGTWRYRG